MKNLTIRLIKFYQIFSRTIIKSNAVPVLLCSSCRFYPSCSDYAIESIQKYGFWKGVGKAAIRILKCNPLSQVTVRNS